MTELERCELAKEIGYTYCPLSGKLRGVYGKVITNKRTDGYISCRVHVGKKLYNILGHRIAWYLYYGKLPVNFIDHKDGVRDNNKIENLRDVTQQRNHFNRTTAKGYSWDKPNKKFRAHIKINKKLIYFVI